MASGVVSKKKSPGAKIVSEGQVNFKKIIQSRYYIHLTSQHKLCKAL